MDVPKLSYTCDLKWTDLQGDGTKRRHCERCDRSVYNLSGMTREAARAVLKRDGERCVHFVSRDGYIVHDGDPLEQLRRQKLGADKLLAAALVVHAAFLTVGGPERVLLDPFTLIPATLVRVFGETTEPKFTTGAAPVPHNVTF